MSGGWLAVAVFVGGTTLTGMLRRYALARSVLDVPNARSSHSVPTPRGGGVSIVLVFLAAVLYLSLMGHMSWDWGGAIVSGGLVIAVIGFWDDHGHVPARWRLLAHFAGAGCALGWLGGMPALPLFGSYLESSWLWTVLAAIYLVWMLNLYNFMDGIDGIAGIEAITVGGGGAGLYWARAEPGSEWMIPLLLAAAAGGFLVWNFPRARIFMGDAGSGFLGFVLGVLSLQAAWVAPELFWAWVILVGAFVADATVTLVRRVWRGEKFYEAHRTHAYQYASRKWGSHIRVSLAFGALNLFWLLPVAVLVARGYIEGIIGVFVAYIPLIWLAFRFKAGARELQDL